MSKNKVTEKYIEFNTDEIPQLIRRGVLDEFSSCWNRKNPNKTFYLKETKQWKDGTIRKQMIELNNAEETQKKVMQEKKMAAQKQDNTVGTLLFAIIGTPIVLVIMIAGLNNSGSSSYSGSSAGYNDSVPSGMTQYESNYIGNRLSEEGYSEQEAKEMRELIHTFNQLQD
jgi:hypothetical protein